MAAALLLLAACTRANEVVFEGGATTTLAAGTKALSASTAGTAAAPSSSPLPSTSSAATTVVAAPPATIPTSGQVLESLPGTIAVTGSSNESMLLLGPNLEFETIDDVPGGFFAQPTWSPDGQFLAWARESVDGVTEVVVRSTVDGTQSAYAVPYITFYMQWRPDSRAIGLLGGGGAGTALVVLDLDDETVSPLHAAGSFYFDWSPDGTSMITHLDSSRLEFFDLDSGDVTLVDSETGIFQAAVWTPNGDAIIYTRPSTIQTAGIGGALVAQAVTVEELVLHHVATGEIEILAHATGIGQFSLAPDGARVAFTAIGQGEESVMRVIDLATGQTEAIEAGFVFALQWSPDSNKIMLMGIDGPDIVYHVWDSGEVTSYIKATPTEIFLRYIRFWGQYDLSMRLWAPDSSAFVFTAEDGDDDSVFLQRLDDDLPIKLGPGSVATFSPAG